MNRLNSSLSTHSQLLFLLHHFPQYIYVNGLYLVYNREKLVKIFQKLYQAPLTSFERGFKRSGLKVYEDSRKSGWKAWIHEGDYLLFESFCVK